MLYRVLGALFVIFGGFLVLGHLMGGETPRAGESGFASQYSNLITGVVLFFGGLYTYIKSSSEKA